MTLRNYYYLFSRYNDIIMVVIFENPYILEVHFETFTNRKKKIK